MEGREEGRSGREGQRDKRDGERQVGQREGRREGRVRGPRCMINLVIISTRIAAQIITGWS